jgi:hypothetical protein
LILASASMAVAAPEVVLFPEPLHIVREIHDPIAGVTYTIDEYCHGDRIITIHGAETVIADFRLDQITEIDRNRGTFSMTPFADVARATSAQRSPSVAKAAGEPRPLGMKQSVDGRQLEAYELITTADDEQVVITVGVDRKTALSLAAVEALLGATFPNRRSFTHDAIMWVVVPRTGTRREQTSAVADVALPSEYSVTYEVADEKLVYRSTAVAVDRRVVPDELVIIPPGSRRVETRLTAIPRAIEELDHPPRPDPR